MKSETSHMWDLTLVIDALGSEDFSSILLTAFNELVAANHLVIIRVDSNLAPQLFATKSYGRTPVAQQAGLRYTRLQLHHNDPNFEKILAQADQPKHPLVTHLLAENITNSTYRHEVFEKSGIAERISFIDQREGRWFIVNIYRDEETGTFSRSELEMITRYAPLVSSLVAKQISIAATEEWSASTRPPVMTLENRVKEFGTSLSSREVEVCARALLGMTSEAIGIELGVKQTTITTHRKRAYTKLNISSVNELFALCLGHTLKQ